MSLASSPSTLTAHNALRVVTLGLQVPYALGMAEMRREMNRLQDDVSLKSGTLLLLEHEDTLTLTRSSGQVHLRKPRAQIEADGICVMQTDRGGDVTYHGTGQLVGYPILRLGPGTGLRVNLLGYVRALEKALLRACVLLGVKGAHLKEGMTGIWVASDPTADPSSFAADEQAAKLVAIGVGVGRGVTRHGFSLNVTTDLERFTDRIVPCGLTGRPVTSLARLLEAIPSFSDVARICTECIAEVLSLELQDADFTFIPFVAHSTNASVESTKAALNTGSAADASFSSGLTASKAVSFSPSPPSNLS